MQGQTNPRIRKGTLQRKLRNQPTDAERRLWQHLRGRQQQGCSSAPASLRKYVSFRSGEKIASNWTVGSTSTMRV